MVLMKAPLWEIVQKLCMAGNRVDSGLRMKYEWFVAMEQSVMSPYEVYLCSIEYSASYEYLRQRCMVLV